MPKSKTAFTIVELLVSTAILMILVLLVGRLFSSAAIITTSGYKRIDAEAQIRPLFDRMAIDFSQMVKRSDVDYCLKSASNSQPGNDQIAFYATVSGYSSSNSLSPVSLVAYRVNSTSTSTSFNKLERMSKGLVWNGASTTDPPILFAPIALASPSSLPSPNGTPVFPSAGNSAPDSDYELIAPYVFRFEYSYLLKSGANSVNPWDTSAGHSSVSGMQDVAAISVCVAAIDPKSRVIIRDSQLTTLTGRLNDFAASMKPGDLLSQWQGALDTATDMPRQLFQGVRIYERYFYLLPRR
jgi:hypothetical protein